jgi:hypothetical protein
MKSAASFANWCTRVGVERKGVVADEKASQLPRSRSCLMNSRDSEEVEGKMTWYTPWCLDHGRQMMIRCYQKLQSLSSEIVVMT